jgi:integrase
VLTLPDSKYGEPRTIHLSDAALSLIATLPRNGERIFAGLGADALRGCWERVRDAAGVRDLRLHDLRRSFASVVLSPGVGLSQVSQLLGHKSAQTTRAYAYLVQEAAADAVALASGRLSQMMEANDTRRHK